MLEMSDNLHLQPLRAGDFAQNRYTADMGERADFLEAIENWTPMPSIMLRKMEDRGVAPELRELVSLWGSDARQFERDGVEYTSVPEDGEVVGRWDVEPGEQRSISITGEDFYFIISQGATVVHTFDVPRGQLYDWLTDNSWYR